MSSILKNVARILGANLLITFLAFVLVLGASVYWVLKFENVQWPLFWLLLLWICPFERPLRIVKLSHTESKQFWSKSLNREFLSICTNFAISFIHCLLITFLIFMGTRLLFALKPSLQTTLKDYMPVYDQILIILCIFLIVLFLATVALPVSIYGDIKRIRSNWKIVLYLLVIFGFELITLFSLHFMGWLIYLFIPLYHVMGILIALILATLLLINLLRNNKT